MEPPAAPCTQRQIATRLGLSVMTVSRALRNAAGVDAATQQRVVEMAERLKYRPDPALSVLNAYRHGRRQRSEREVVAFVTNFPTAGAWKHVPTFARYFEGARARAEQLGYRVEPFWVGDPALTPKRASHILRERGIRGVLVGPLAHGHSELNLEWDWFSAVALGRSLASPELTTVSTNHFQVVERAWTEVWARGYRRIGLALTAYEDDRTNGLLRGSVLLQQDVSGAPVVPSLVTSTGTTAEISAWSSSHRVDVVMGSENSIRDAVKKLRRAVPWVHLNVDPQSGDAGIDQGHDHVGEHAAALLHLKMIQRQTGRPARRDLLLIDGHWHEGSTPLPPRKSARAAKRRSF